MHVTLPGDGMQRVAHASRLPCGVRIEDIVTVTEGGPVRLNNTNHGLAVVE
jgi:hypothetical protein